MRLQVAVTSCAIGLITCISVSRAAEDLSSTIGVQITPDKTALEDGRGVQPQQSRLGPSAGVEYRHWFSGHHGVEFELDYANTNTRLQNFAFNTWTMNRLSIDGAYEWRWNFHNVSPYVKAGVGALVTLSGRADPPGQGWVGLDDRLEEIAGAGLNYRLSRRFSLLAEYECHLFRNPDFSDHTWHPERNEVSEPKLGITYTFRGER